MKLTKHPAVATTKVLITGMPGSGKTTLAAALAERYNIVWIDLERGASTLTKLPTEWQERIDLVSLPDSASYPVASDTLTQLFKSGKADICQTHGKVNCGLCKKAGAGFDSIDFSKLTSHDVVVIDTVTQLSHSILSHVTRGQPVDYKPERDDWGSLRKLTEFFCSQFQAANFNLVCIAHVVEAKMEDNRTKLVPSFGSAGMSAEFAKAFDHVIYCETKNGKHVAGSSTGYSNSVLTKSRTDFCIEKLPTPSLLPLFTLPSEVAIVDNTVAAIAAVPEPEIAEVSTAQLVVSADTPAVVASGNDKLAAIRAQIAAKAAAKLVAG